LLVVRPVQDLSQECDLSRDSDLPQDKEQGEDSEESGVGEHNGDRDHLGMLYDNGTTGGCGLGKREAGGPHIIKVNENLKRKLREKGN
jgi:hypothetical protein